MVNVRNVQGKDAFLDVMFREAFGYFGSLDVFHNYYHIRPGELFFSDRLLVVKACRLGIKPVLKKMLSCFASVLVLITDKQNVHNIKKSLTVINFTKQVIFL